MLSIEVKSLFSKNQDFRLQEPESAETKEWDMRPVVVGTFLAMFAGFAGSVLSANAQPSLLGRGYTPYLNQVQEAVATPPPLPIADGSSNLISFGMLATNVDFERVIEADMSVSADKVGWGFKVKASLKKEFRENRKQVTFAATQQVIRGTVTLPSPVKLTGAAAAMVSRNAPKYLLAYGTSVIDTVDLGGSAVFLFTFNFASEEEAMRFSVNADGRYGAFKGDLRYSIRELLKTATNDIRVSGFVTGTTKLPNFFGPSSATNGARSEFHSAKYSEEMLQNILTYLNEFEKTIGASAVEQLSQVSFTDRHVSNLSNVRLDKKAIAVFQDAEAYGVDLNDKLESIDDRRNELQHMTTVLKKFNTDANLARALLMDQVLIQSAQSVERLRNELGTFGAIDRQRAAQVQVPVLPATFCTTEPTEISPRKFQPLDAGNPQNQASSPPRKWLEYVVTPRFTNVTYTFWATLTLAHSRTDPGCNHGHIDVRARKRGPFADPSTPELGSWVRRQDVQLSPEEEEVDNLGPLTVCRKQPTTTTDTKPYAFVAAETRDLRVLFSNWDDIGYTVVQLRVFRCGQPAMQSGARPDLVR